MKLQRFILGDILIDTRINTREIDEKTVAEYQADMLEYGADTWQSRWKGLPKVTSTGQLWSGFHTLAAATRAFGPAHVIECEVEGDTYHDAFLLATGENADHGRRRTSQEKHAAVARWLRDDEGKLWTNNHIAKRCKVSRTVVDNVLLALKASDPTYARPTTLKYINRYGKEAWMETATLATPPRADDDRQPPSRETRAETLETARETFGTAGTALMAAVDAFLGDCAADGLQYRRGYVTRRILSGFGIDMAPHAPPPPEAAVDKMLAQVTACQQATAALLHHQASALVTELRELDRLFAAYAAYEVFNKTVLTEAAQELQTEMRALLRDDDFELLSSDARLAHVQELQSRLVDIVTAEERAQTAAACLAAQERKARELAEARQDATESQAEVQQAFFAHPAMEATDEAWRAFCHAASACPDINGEAEVLATKERLLALPQEEALHYAMRFNGMLLALKQGAAWVADFAAAAREKPACHSEPPDVFEQLHVSREALKAAVAASILTCDFRQFCGACTDAGGGGRTALNAEILADGGKQDTLSPEEALGYLDAFAAFHEAVSTMADDAWVWQLVEADTAGFQAYLETTGYPSLCRTLTAASNTARQRLSRTYRLPVAEIETGIADFIKPEQDRIAAQERCTTVMETAHRTFEEHPVAFRIPWRHFVSAAREEKGAGLAWLDVNAPHSRERLETAISLWEEVIHDIKNRVSWVTALEGKQAPRSRQTRTLTPRLERVTCYTDIDNNLWVPMKGAVPGKTALVYVRVTLDENGILTLIRNQQGHALGLPAAAVQLSSRGQPRRKGEGHAQCGRQCDG